MYQEEVPTILFIYKEHLELELRNINKNYSKQNGRKGK